MVWRLKSVSNHKIYLDLYVDEHKKIHSNVDTFDSILLISGSRDPSPAALPILDSWLEESRIPIAGSFFLVDGWLSLYIYIYRLNIFNNSFYWLMKESKKIPILYWVIDVTGLDFIP